MKKNALKIFVITTSFLVFGAACYYWGFMGQKNTLLSCANATLYDLYDVIDLLEYLERAESNDPIIIEKSQIMLVKNLILIRDIDPQISKLQGTPLKALCRTIAYLTTPKIDSKIFFLLRRYSLLESFAF